MDAARALADLVEISPQIDAAVVVAGDAETVGSIGVPEERRALLARVVHELISSAGSFRSEGRVTQLHATLAEGDVFAVAREDGRAIAAVTSGNPSPGLVFYDLKRCLGSISDES